MILLDSTMFIVNKQKVISAEQLGQEALNLGELTAPRSLD